MRNIKITIEYDGKNFAGWQSQPGKVSIQSEIEKAIKEITGEECEVIASGRTDAGVHALGQVANFHTNSNIEIEKMPYAINSKLTKSIVITKAEEVDERFHSRYNCKLKTYRYIVNNAEFPSALERYREYHMPIKLDVEAMKEAVELLIGTHDFKGFASASIDERKPTIKTIYSIDIINHGDKLEFIFIGNGFLKYQIRRMMGIIVEIGKGRFTKNKIIEILESKNPADSNTSHRNEQECFFPSGSFQ